MTLNTLFTTPIKKLRLFLTQSEGALSNLRPHLQRVVNISTKCAIFLKNKTIIATNKTSLLTQKLITVLIILFGPIVNTIIATAKKALLLAHRFVRYAKGKFDSLIYLIILLTEKAIVVAENTPEHLLRLFRFTEKCLDALTKYTSFIFKIIAIPTNKVFSLLLSVLRFIKSKFDSLIYLIILLTEKAITIAENTPEHLLRLFRFTEKCLDSLTKYIAFIFRIIAIPTSTVVSLLLSILRFVKNKFDSLIYLIILLTEKAIAIVENIPQYLLKLFLLTEKGLNWLIKITSLALNAVVTPARKILSLLLAPINRIKKLFDSLIYSIILLTEKIIVIVENTPKYILTIAGFIKRLLVSIFKSLATLIYKIASFIKNGAASTKKILIARKNLLLALSVIFFIKRKRNLINARNNVKRLDLPGKLKRLSLLIFSGGVLLKNSIIQIVTTVFKAIGFIIRSIANLIYKIFVAIKNGITHIKTFFIAKKNLLLAKVAIFFLRRKRNQAAARKNVKQSALLYKLKQYALLIRLDKPIGILLLLWPTLMALWIAAEGWPDQDVLLVFIAGVFLMRSAGCAINDYADRHIDCDVTRTKERPLTSGKISETEALVIFSILCIMAFFLVLLMNPLTIAMSFVGLILAASYPFMKRHTYFPQIHLGAAFGWAVPMAYTAQTNEVTTVTWLLFIATVLWATAYDTMYAMVDREDDLKIGVKSTAILFESADTLIIGIIQALLILCLIMVGQRLDLGIFYFSGILVATGLAVWQQHLIRNREPAMCFKAFLNNHWFGLALFAGVFLEYQIGDITL